MHITIRLATTTPMIHNFGCVMVVPEGFPSQEVQSLIKDSELYIDPQDPSYGRSEPHVTALYGIREMEVGPRIQKLIQNVSFDEIQIQGVSCFYSDNYDVVKADVVNTGCITQFRKLLEAEFPDFENTHGDYKPHLTLAYVKKGLGDLVAKRFNLVGTYKVASIEYSQQNGESLFFIP